jgi:peptidoglycan LD-endopeptidase LytH
VAWHSERDTVRAAAAAPPPAAARPAPKAPVAARPAAPATVPARRSGSPASLSMPVQGITATQLRDSFTERHSGHAHEAIDIMAAEGTPVVAVEDGRIAKLFTSVAGGLTIYQFDPGETWCYYYAHLHSYAPGMFEGRKLERGEVIGYVGHTGNAAADAPHLHFAIFRLNEQKQWWKGEPVNPYPILSRRLEARLE